MEKHDALDLWHEHAPVEVVECGETSRAFRQCGRSAPPRARTLAAAATIRRALHYTPYKNKQSFYNN
ncbi:hypothetical protein RR48_02360 [Papilio machaon]|uniref:Uncharacterized protein n=1 Tax=Papilio machaon TaxID=76193 RepID=A0A0N1IPJ2_PAPMA|nr:hypothetical protein RR48_02360 [Papilio machaon]